MSVVQNPDSPQKRQLKVSLNYLLLMFDLPPERGIPYLDRSTGDILIITNEDRRQYDYFLETLEPGDDRSPERLDALMQAQGVPFLVREVLREVAEVNAEPDRYLRIPGENPVLDVQDMSAFIDEVEDGELQELLEACFAGGGNLSRYKAILLKRDRQALKRWMDFRQERQHKRMMKWLSTQGIEPVTG
ncbi:MAG: hypothetical protein IAE83_20525 [Anaerolinea sp.]|nr:hypothetical protein [Anaerolinea sp.]MCC6974648.1 hypothetical protein [Anaerolineae bacterium]